MGRYEPLTRFLASRSEAEVRLTFQDVENILNRPLPSSAREHQAWWSNTQTHSHAESWLKPGWRTRDLDRAGERVTFARVDDVERRSRPTADNDSDEAVIAVRRETLAPAAAALVDRYVRQHSCSSAQAVADLLVHAAIERKRRLLEQFPLTGTRSSIDSADLIREDRDAR